MHVEFAAYGDRDGAHGVLRATFNDPVVERTLPVTDLAWGLPDRLGEIPMYRGRPTGDYYVIVKTLRDPEASRSGMAASVAAFFPLDEVIHEVSFKGLIALLPTPAHDPPTLESQNVRQSAGRISIPDAPGIRALTGELLTRESGRPAVWAGIDSFIDVIAPLWMMLPATLRRTFAFAFVCDPSDGECRRCSVVYCPNELASRWTGQLVTKESSQPIGLELTAEQYFLDASVRQQVESTIIDLGATISSFADLRRACLCHDTLRDLPSASSLDATKLLRNVAVLSPSKGLGIVLKQKVIDDVFRRIQSDGASTISLIRNIDFVLFGASQQLNDACYIGIQRNLRESSASIKVVAELIKQATTHRERSWSDGVVRGVTAFAQSADDLSSRRIWELLGEQPSLASESTIVFPSKPKADSHLAATAPTPINPEVATILTDEAVRHGYPELYAVVLASLSNLHAAVERICENWLDNERLASLRRLSTRIGRGEFLKCVDSFEADELIDVAAEICTREPKLLAAAFSGTSHSWRLVFSRIAEVAPTTIDGVEGLDIEVARSIQLLHEGHLESQYQVSLSQTKYANVLAAKNRAMLWSRVDPAALPAFLNATARTWIHEIHRGSTAAEDLEPDLRDAILDLSMRSVLLPSDGEGVLERVVSAFDALPQLDENDFEQWRQSFLDKNRSLSKVDAILLGQFVQSRSWEYVAAKLADDVNWYRRADLRPAVSQFLDLLGWIKRWQFGDYAVSVSPDEWWNELATTLTSLYSDGPSSSGVWERANGDPADLLTDGTGANQWRRCLRDLRNGLRSDELSVKSLLKVVATDYFRNPTVKILRDTCPT